MNLLFTIIVTFFAGMGAGLCTWTPTWRWALPFPRMCWPVRYLPTPTTKIKTWISKTA